MSHVHPESILKKTILDGRAIFVSGTGVSIAASFDDKTKQPHPQASWKGLLEAGLEWLKQHDLMEPDVADAHLVLLRKSPQTHHLISTAEDITVGMGGSQSSHFSDWLARTVGTIVSKNQHILDALNTVRQHGNLLATTNYDGLLLGNPPTLTPVTWQETDSFISTVRSWNNDNIIYLHGYWRKPESVILDWKSYDRISRNEAYRQDLGAFWKTTTWVFVGCGVSGLSDPDFGLLLERYGARQADQLDFCLVCGESQRQDFQAYFDNLKLNIRAISYGESHSDLAPYLQSLVPSPTVTAVHSSATTKPVGLQSEPELRLFFNHLIQSHTKLFAGREDELKNIMTFVLKQGSGYVFVEGPSGYGKTSLLAELVRRQSQFAFHFISQGYKTIGSDFDPTQLEALLANLCEQLGGTYPQFSDLRSLRIQFTKQLASPPEFGQRVIVIDGIDEVDRHPNYLLGLLPRKLPEHVVVVLSARTQGDRCYLSEIGLDRRDIALYIPLSGLDEAAIAHLLVCAGGAGIEAATRSGFIARLRVVSSGDPFYLRFLIEDVARGRLTMDNIDTVPTGLPLYFDQQLSQLNRNAFRPQHRDILGFVLEAHGPLGRTDLMHLVPNLDGLNFDDVIRDIHRFLLVHDDQYTFCHKRFAEYFANRSQ